jgi:hypothetical protein
LRWRCDAINAGLATVTGKDPTSCALRWRARLMDERRATARRRPCGANPRDNPLLLVDEAEDRLDLFDPSLRQTRRAMRPLGFA